MEKHLCNSIIIGPIQSRRNGRSLVINLMSSCSRRCIFNCSDCDYLKDVREEDQALPEPYAVVESLMQMLQQEIDLGNKIENISFAGAGEPTLHPKFPDIMEDVVLIRNLISPDTSISIITNAAGVSKPVVMKALMKVNHLVLKYDANANDLINHELIANISQIKKHLKGEFSVQSIFYEGDYRGHNISNASEDLMTHWANQMASLKPLEVILYMANRDFKLVSYTSREKQILKTAADRLKSLKIKTTLAQNQSDPII